MSGSVTLPSVFTSTGLQPTPPATLNALVIQQATALAPGLTVLPAGLIEDLSSTATGALVVIDQARVDLVASVSPNAANPYILSLLGACYGVAQGQGTNTGVYVVFTNTTAVGYVIPAGFVVSDGTYQYQIQSPGVIGSSGSSQPLSALATQAGTWAITPNSVTQIITSVPSNISANLTVTNPLAGSPGLPVQSEESYRSQVVQAGYVTATGMPAMLKTLLGNVTGVNPSLVSIRAQTGGGWEIIVGGSGDPVQIGFAILQSLFDISTLTGSVLSVTNITNASPAVITTNLNHGYSSGQTVVINGATGLTALNGQSLVATVISETTFSVPFNTTTSGTYTGNGVATPNFRNVTTSIYNYPDTYVIPYVIPPSQTVNVVVTWNALASGYYVSAAAVASAAQPMIANYINALPVGQPINQFELQAVFQQATSSLFPNQLLTRMVFAVSINGVAVAPEPGTGIIAGDPESYFVTTTASIVVNQG